MGRTLVERCDAFYENTSDKLYVELAKHLIPYYTTHKMKDFENVGITVGAFAIDLVKIIGYGTLAAYVLDKF